MPGHVSRPYAGAATHRRAKPHLRAQRPVHSLDSASRTSSDDSRVKWKSDGRSSRYKMEATAVVTTTHACPSMAALVTFVFSGERPTTGCACRTSRATSQGIYWVHSTRGAGGFWPNRAHASAPQDDSLRTSACHRRSCLVMRVQQVGTGRPELTVGSTASECDLAPGTRFTQTGHGRVREGEWERVAEGTSKLSHLDSIQGRNASDCQSPCCTALHCFAGHPRTLDGQHTGCSRKREQRMLGGRQSLRSKLSVAVVSLLCRAGSGPFYAVARERRVTCRQRHQPPVPDATSPCEGVSARLGRCRASLCPLRVPLATDYPWYLTLTQRARHRVSQVWQGDGWQRCEEQASGREEGRLAIAAGLAA